MPELKIEGFGVGAQEAHVLTASTWWYTHAPRCEECWWKIPARRFEEAVLWVWDLRNAGGSPELSVTGYSEKGTRRLQIMNDGQGYVGMSFINRPCDFASFFSWEHSPVGERKQSIDRGKSMRTLRWEVQASWLVSGDTEKVRKQKLREAEGLRDWNRWTC